MKIYTTTLIVGFALMGCVNSITSMAVNTATQAFGHTGSRPRGFDSGLSLFVKVQNWDAAALRYSVTLVVDSTTSKAVNTVAHTFWYKITKPERPRGFDSGVLFLPKSKMVTLQRLIRAATRAYTRRDTRKPDARL
jgi:hypothetical protein